jgi:uncharacterized protein YutE (UPF0331/DUF86 family)
MDEQRKKRCLEKIELIRRRVAEINSWKAGFFAEEKDRLAVYKAFQEAAEACMDIVNMILVDKNIVSSEDYKNIEKIQKAGLITNKLKISLIEINGLRNRVVHEYNGLDDKIALNSMEDLLPDIEEFTGVMEKWIRKK